MSPDKFMVTIECKIRPSLKSGDNTIFVIIDGSEVLAVFWPRIRLLIDITDYQHQGIDKGGKERRPTQTVKLEDVSMTWTCSLT